jgi:hypothetical protein
MDFEQQLQGPVSYLPSNRAPVRTVQEAALIVGDPPGRE